ERERIGAVIEERIIANLDRVKEHVLHEPIETRRNIRADEVHAMAALGERQPDLGRDDAAAAERGIARDSDAQLTAHSSMSRTCASKGPIFDSTFCLRWAMPNFAAK